MAEFDNQLDDRVVMITQIINLKGSENRDAIASNCCTKGKAAHGRACSFALHPWPWQGGYSQPCSGQRRTVDHSGRLIMDSKGLST